MSTLNEREVKMRFTRYPLHFSLFFFAAVACQSFLAVCGQDRSAEAIRSAIAQLKTVAEQSNYERTANGDEVHTFLSALDAASPNARLVSIGVTTEERPIWALILGDAALLELPRKPNDNRLVIGLLGGIHSGECDGKEALLALCRDWCGDVQASRFANAVFVVIPNFSADSAERIGQHRPGQVGPAAGMGIRENAQGLDLNRDFVKLESPEVRSLVRTIDQWGIDVLIDTHTTNGSLHRYQLTYDLPHNPATPQGIRAWGRSTLLPKVTERMKVKGFETFFYGNFNSSYDRWETYGHEPRYGTEYMGLRGRLGILSESYSYADYRTRIDATYAFVQNCVDVLLEEKEALQAEFQRADQRGANRAEASIPIRAEIAPVIGEFKALGYRYKEGKAPADRRFPSSADRDRLDTLEPNDYAITLWNDAKPTSEVAMPAAYIIPPNYAWAVDRLAMHGVRVEQSTSGGISLPVERYTIKSIRNENFEGLPLQKVEVESASVSAEIPEKSFVIRTDQPLGVLVSYLLEPASDETLAGWGFMPPTFREADHYPVLRVMQQVALSTKPIDAVPPSIPLSLESLLEPGRTLGLGGGGRRGSGSNRWLPDSTEYLASRGNRVYAVEAATGAMRPFDLAQRLADSLAKTGIQNRERSGMGDPLGSFDSSLRFALVRNQNDLFLFDAASGETKRLTNTPEDAEGYAELSPTGDHVAFIRGNNLYVVECATGDTHQITSDGSAEVLNGVLDWVYQEEVYGRGNFKAYWWSPDGRSIAFLQLHENDVPEFRVNDSISYSQNLELTRYPKAGAPNPTANAFLVDVSSREVKPVELSEYSEKDRLLVRFAWHPTSAGVTIQIQNRIQTWLDLVWVDRDSAQTRKLFREEGPAWIDVLGLPQFLSNGDFLWLSDLPAGRRHLYRVSGDGTQRQAITSGDWDVEDVLLVEPDEGTVWIRGNLAHPIEQHVYRVSLSDNVITPVTHLAGTHSANVHPSGRYFIHSYTSISSPGLTELCDRNGKRIRVLNAPTQDLHRMVDAKPPTLFTIPARDGQPLHSMLIAPPHVDLAKPDGSYPVLIYVYGGPRAPTVSNSWGGRDLWWHQYLAQQGIFVLLCDNRAARGNGAADTWKTYKDLGRIETEDLSDAVAWLSQQPWADPDRIAMWGWSYGGYFTAYAMTHTKLFRAGIAGAPVTDWRNYDSIYTERYMDVPDNNKAGYKSSSAVEAAANLHGRLLILHGEIDDNVHLNNSMQLAYALQRANKPFDLMVYPKNRHGVGDPMQRYHMYRLMTEFLIRNLKDSAE